MDKRIIFATGNQNKVRELNMILQDAGIPIVSMKDAGIASDIAENGKTFRENALIKAKAVAEASGEIALADDSGLVIDALNGEPGIYSARFMGRDTSYSIKNKALIDRMKDVPDEKRTARFVCDVAVVFPDGRTFVEEGIMEGRIAHRAAGENGFGYDPVFYLPEYGCTSAQLPPEKKNEISHRGKALKAMRQVLARELNKDA